MSKLKCAVLTTDTTHHRYFVNCLAPHTELFVVLETAGLDFQALYWKWIKARKSLASFWDNPYLVKSYPTFGRNQEAYEARFFEGTVAREFTGDASYVRFPSVNNADCLAALQAFKPDLVVSFGTGKIAENVLATNAMMVNIHRGLLPPYRGLDSDLWAMYFQDFDNIGCTVHRLEPELDTGPIIYQGRVDVTAGMKAHHIRYHTTVFATNVIVDLIRKISTGVEVIERPWDRAAAGYYSFIPYFKRRRAIQQFHAYTQHLGAA